MCWALFYMLEIQQGAKQTEIPGLVGIQPVLGAPVYMPDHSGDLASMGHTPLVTSMEPSDGPAAFFPFSMAQGWRTRSATDQVPELSRMSVFI